MPTLQTLAATSSRGMLGYKNGMTSPRGLLAIFNGVSWGQPLGDEVSPMFEDGRDSFLSQILTLALW